MNRRGFLSLLAPAAALIIAPELLIPKRTFFLPPTGGWSSMDYRRYWEDAIYRAAYPPVLANERLAQSLMPMLLEPGAINYAMEDLVLYGRCATKFDFGTGRIHHVPVHDLVIA